MPLPPLPLMTLESWNPMLTVAWYENDARAARCTIPTTWLPSTESSLVTSSSDRAGIVQVDPRRGAERAVGIAPDGHPASPERDCVEPVWTESALSV